MTLDLALSALVCAFALGGLSQGASGQLAKLLAFAAAVSIGLLLGPFVAGATGVPAQERVLAASLGVGVVIYLAAAAVLRSWLPRLFERTAGRKVDRLLGFVLGAVRGAFLASLFLLLIPSFNRALALSHSRLRLRTQGSRLYRFASAHRPPRARPSRAGGVSRIVDRFNLLQLPMGDP